MKIMGLRPHFSSALGIFGHPGDSGVAFFVMSIIIYLISSAGMAGLLMFEASRLFGFEARLTEEENKVANNHQTNTTGSAA